MRNKLKIIFKILGMIVACVSLLLIIIYILVVLLPTINSIFFKPEVKHAEYMMYRFNFDISTCEIKHSFDNYAGSFNGDGDYALIADCKNKDDINEYFETWNSLPASSKISDWKELPMPEDLHQKFYSSLEDLHPELYSTSNVDEKHNIPVVINGYYYFIDRTPGAVDMAKYNEFGKTRNYTVAIFDTDTKMFYYYDYDS